MRILFQCHSARRETSDQGVPTVADLSDRNNLKDAVLRPVFKKATIRFIVSVRLSFCPHDTNRLPINGFLLNLIFELSSKICSENSSLTKIRRE
jgi:hypothetical protein